jgi:hypothetical protein
MQLHPLVYIFSGLHIAQYAVVIENTWPSSIKYLLSGPLIKNFPCPGLETRSQSKCLFTKEQDNNLKNSSIFEG